MANETRLDLNFPFRRCPKIIHIININIKYLTYKQYKYLHHKQIFNICYIIFYSSTEETCITNFGKKNQYLHV